MRNDNEENYSLFLLTRKILNKITSKFLINANLGVGNKGNSGNFSFIVGSVVLNLHKSHFSRSQELKLHLSFRYRSPVTTGIAEYFRAEL